MGGSKLYGSDIEFKNGHLYNTDFTSAALNVPGEITFIGMGNNGFDDEGNDDGSNPNTDFTNVNFKELETSGASEAGPDVTGAYMYATNVLEFKDNHLPETDFTSASLYSAGGRMENNDFTSAKFDDAEIYAS